MDSFRLSLGGIRTQHTGLSPASQQSATDPGFGLFADAHTTSNLLQIQYLHQPWGFGKAGDFYSSGTGYQRETQKMFPL